MDGRCNDKDGFAAGEASEAVCGRRKADCNAMAQGLKWALRGTGEEGWGCDVAGDHRSAIGSTGKTLAIFRGRVIRQMSKVNRPHASISSQ